MSIGKKTTSWTKWYLDSVGEYIKLISMISITSYKKQAYIIIE